MSYFERCLRKAIVVGIALFYSIAHVPSTIFASVPASSSADAARDYEALDNLFDRRSDVEDDNLAESSADHDWESVNKSEASYFKAPTGLHIFDQDSVNKALDEIFANNYEKYKQLITALTATDRSSVRPYYVRIIRGGSLYFRIMTGQRPDVATKDDVADLEWFFFAQAASGNSTYTGKNIAFQEGMFVIEDQDGNLCQFLKSCEGLYSRERVKLPFMFDIRFSSHFHESQLVDGHGPWGIDFDNAGYLTWIHKNILFGRLTGDNQGWTYFKPEEAGLGSASHISEHIQHYFAKIGGRGHESGATQQKEHPSAKLLTEFTDLIKEYNSLIDPSKHIKLYKEENHRLKEHGYAYVYALYLRMSHNLLHNSANEDCAQLLKKLSGFMYEQFEHYPDFNKRKGNEVRFKVKDLIVDAYLYDFINRVKSDLSASECMRTFSILRNQEAFNESLSSILLGTANDAIKIALNNMLNPTNFEHIDANGEKCLQALRESISVVSKKNYIENHAVIETYCDYQSIFNRDNHNLYDSDSDDEEMTAGSSSSSSSSSNSSVDDSFVGGAPINLAQHPRTDVDSSSSSEFARSSESRWIDDNNDNQTGIIGTLAGWAWSVITFIPRLVWNIITWPFSG